MTRAVELLGLVGIPDARAPRRRVPARVLGRHAPAGDDRDGAHQRPAAADRRRADDGARRHHPGADPAPARGACSEEFGMAMIMITHDLGVVAEVADRVNVMYAGEVVESGTLDQIFYDPQHPYTWGLLGSLTRIDRPRTARLAQIAGQPPSLIALPAGMPFPQPRARTRSSKLHADAAARAASRPGGPLGPLLAVAGAEADAARDRGRRDRARGSRRMTRVRAGRRGARGDTPRRRRPSARDRGDPACGEAILEVDHVVKHFPIKAGIIFDQRDRPRCGRSTTSRSPSRRARRSAWSASPAAASRR